MNWNWRQRRMRLLLGVAVLACAVALAQPSCAHAGWPLRDAGSVALGFGATYRAAEATTSSTHRGIDISAESGAAVVAPLGGSVAFVGRIPAVGGGTVRAVTIATAEGSVTLLPLSAASVSKGDSLAEGDAVGTLAASGDGSSAGVHLHVGLKRGDLYVDPLSVLTLPVAAPAGGGEGAGVPAAVRAGSSARAGTAAARTSGGARASVGGQAASRAPAGAGSPAPLRAAVPGQSVAPGVSVAGASVAVGEAAAAPTPAVAGSRSIAAAPQAHSAATAANPSLVELAIRFAHFVLSATKAASLALFALLLAVGALWPLWRRESRKGSGEVRVSALDDDVAAAVGR
jgi:hypothetical protein